MTQLKCDDKFYEYMDSMSLNRCGAKRPAKPIRDGRWQSAREWCFDILKSIVLLVAFVVLVCAILFVSGCAAGKTATGGVVVGFDVAALPETAGEAIGAASEFLPEPWRSLALGGVTLLGGGGLLGYAKKKGEAQGWEERESHQAKIDATYDLGRTEAKSGGGK